MIGAEERAAVAAVLDGPILVHGPQATGFEAAFAAYTGAPHAISVSSCTAGMHLVWFTLGLGPGDEVIVPAQTHVATAHAVELTGARAVFVDSEAATGNVDLTAVEAAVTPRTRAIAVVHYLGVPVDMPKLVAIARAHHLAVLEDCALATGARVDGQHVGLLGDVGVFSFYPVKHMTTAEGGMIITRDGDLAARLRLRRAFGVDRAHGERTTPGAYDVTALGFNYRMSEIHAALGVAQVRKLDRFLVRRRENFRALSARLAGVPGLTTFDAPGGPLLGSWYCYAALLSPGLAARRAAIVQALRQEGVGTSVYYPHPVPRLTWYRERYGWQADRFPIAAWISDASIALPVGPHLDADDMAYVADVVSRTLEGHA
jgi:dTDP-4-amino-4,6-dideoxygalactose transaminase